MEICYMKKHYVVAASKIWDNNLIEKLNKLPDTEFTLIREREQLNYKFLSELQPRYIFFPHWSYFIPSRIYEDFECVIFHMTDLPFGRGGSPLQNLIERGIYETRISALNAIKKLDAGDIYLKRSLSLYGSAEEIYIRTTKLITEMIKIIVETEPTPMPQSGQPVEFKRRKPEQSNTVSLDSLEKVFDYIRMLDAEGYPKAYLETEHLRFEFTRAVLKKDCVIADVKIVKREATS